MIFGVQNEDICYDSYSAFNIESLIRVVFQISYDEKLEILIYDVQNEDNSMFYRVYNNDTVELRYKKGPRDWQILFATTNFLYIEVLWLLLG